MLRAPFFYSMIHRVVPAEVQVLALMHQRWCPQGWLGRGIGRSIDEIRPPRDRFRANYKNGSLTLRRYGGIGRTPWQNT